MDQQQKGQIHFSSSLIIINIDTHLALDLHPIFFLISILSHFMLRRETLWIWAIAMRWGIQGGLWPS